MRCKCCREKFEPKYFNQKFCLETDPCIKAHVEMVKKQRQKEWNKRKRKIKEDLKTTQDYHDECQMWFNKIVRHRDRDKGCISCGVSLKNRKYDAGHYYSVASSSQLRYSFNNVHGQCVRCNRDLSANLIEYRKGLLERIGEEWLEYLDTNAHNETRYDIPELKMLISKYKKMYKDMTLDGE